jgi:hypothetical protein
MDPRRQCPDLYKDPVYRWLEQGGDWKLGYAKCVSFSLLLRAILYYLFGFEVMMASFVAGILAFNMPLILNIMCHIPKLGYRNFAIADDSVNNHFFGVVALGDGWHNNHHAHPGSSNMGLKKHEFDTSFFVLKCLQKVGLVYTINETMRGDRTNELEIAEDADVAMKRFAEERDAEAKAAVNGNVPQTQPAGPPQDAPFEDPDKTLQLEINNELENGDVTLKIEEPARELISTRQK